jgi:cobalamin biosynthetic protein CobC
LARLGILTRLYPAPKSLRFGLPGSDSDWSRLARALDLYSSTRFGAHRRFKTQASI